MNWLGWLPFLNMASYAASGCSARTELIGLSPLIMLLILPEGFFMVILVIFEPKLVFSGAIEFL